MSAPHPARRVMRRTEQQELDGRQQRLEPSAQVELQLALLLPGGALAGRTAHPPLAQGKADEHTPEAGHCGLERLI
eukprot:scaffold2123_cov111-Isochrysis_galbana.AAC.5